MQRQLFIMVKEPQAGRVKTRLGADIGMTTAVWWFRHQIQRLIRKLARDPRWETTLAVSPDRAGLESSVWPVDVLRTPQGQGDLGDRMARIFRGAPKGPVVIVGADIPDITPALIEKAFRALGQNDVVFGPAHDGGYWLIGMKRSRGIPPDLFVNVRWSTQYALTDTQATLGNARVTFIDRLRDVDNVNDLDV